MPPLWKLLGFCHPWCFTQSLALPHCPSPAICLASLWAPWRQRLCFCSSLLFSVSDMVSGTKQTLNKLSAVVASSTGIVRDRFIMEFKCSRCGYMPFEKPFSHNTPFFLVGLLPLGLRPVTNIGSKGKGSGTGTREKIGIFHQLPNSDSKTRVDCQGAT